MTNGEGKAREKLEEHTRKKKTFPRVCYFRDEVLFRKLLFVPVLRSWKGGRGGREGWNCDGDGIYIYRPATVVSLLNTANSCRCQNMFDCVNGMGYIYVHVQGRDGKMRYSV